MLTQDFANLINESNNTIKLQFGKFVFVFSTSPGKVIFEVTSDNDVFEVEVATKESLMKLANAISRQTKTEYPDDGISTYIAITNIYHSLDAEINIGPNVETSSEMIQLIKGLIITKEPSEVHGHLYKSTLKYNNNMIELTTTKPNAYHNVTRFTRANTISDIVDCVLKLHQQLNSGEEPNRVTLHETISTIGEHYVEHMLQLSDDK